MVAGCPKAQSPLTPAPGDRQILCRHPVCSQTRNLVRDTQRPAEGGLQPAHSRLVCDARFPVFSTGRSSQELSGRDLRHLDPSSSATTAQLEVEGGSRSIGFERNWAARSFSPKCTVTSVRKRYKGTR